MSDRFFIDTNILVYANDSTNTEKNVMSREIILQGMQDDTLVLSTQVLSEFYVTVTKKIERPLSTIEAKEEIELLKSAEVLEISMETILKAIDLSERVKVSYWDALIIASAIAAKCPVIYSEDLSSGQKIESTSIFNPYLEK
jgi:predicted nucleic acid-binding protein